MKRGVCEVLCGVQYYLDVQALQCCVWESAMHAMSEIRHTCFVEETIAAAAGTAVGIYSFSPHGCRYNGDTQQGPKASRLARAGDCASYIVVP